MGCVNPKGYFHTCMTVNNCPHPIKQSQNEMSLSAAINNPDGHNNCTTNFSDFFNNTNHTGTATDKNENNGDSQKMNIIVVSKNQPNKNNNNNINTNNNTNENNNNNNSNNFHLPIIRQCAPNESPGFPFTNVPNTNNINQDLTKNNSNKTNSSLNSVSSMNNNNNNNNNNNTNNNLIENAHYQEDKIKTMIKYPKIKLSFYSNTQFTLLDEVYLTPNTLYRKENEPTIKDTGYKFSFGCSKDNDCVLNDPNIAAKQFSVYYESSLLNFYAVDNISGTGLFVKITDKLIINHDMIVSFCADHMYIQVRDLPNKTKDLTIKFLQSNHRKELNFNSGTKVHITIGRGNKCDIKHNGDSVSKIHCTIKYEGSDWILYDGMFNGQENKKSTNGLWLLANTGTELKNDVMLKTGIYKIIVELEEELNKSKKENNNEYKDEGIS